MTATIWLHDSAGAWLADVTDCDGSPLAGIAHCPDLRGIEGARIRIEGEIEQGLTLTTIRAHWWTVIEDEPAAPSVLVASAAC